MTRQQGARLALTMIESKAHETNKNKGEEEVSRGQRNREGRRRTGRLGRTSWAQGISKKKKNSFCRIVRGPIAKGKDCAAGSDSGTDTAKVMTSPFHGELTSRFCRQYQQNVCLQFLHIIWAQPSLRSM